MSCVNCENFKTDPFTWKIKRLREKKAGFWKKGVFKKKKVSERLKRLMTQTFVI